LFHCTAQKGAPGEKKLAGWMEKFYVRDQEEPRVRESYLLVFERKKAPNRTNNGGPISRKSYFNLRESNH